MSTQGPDDFQVTDTIYSPSKRQVMSSLPAPESIYALKPLKKAAPVLFDKIIYGLRLVYSYITDREYKENTVTFFHHAGSTALYEKFCRTKINGKDHGKKLGIIFPYFTGTLKEIETALADPLLKEHEKTLLDFQAEYIWQINILVLVIKSLSPETQDHLRNHCNIDSDSLSEMLTSPRKKERVNRLHPLNPSNSLPKELSAPDKLSAEALRNNGSPVKPIRSFRTVLTDLIAEPIDMKAVSKMVPRNVKIIKKTFTPQFKKQLLNTPSNVEPQGLTQLVPASEAAISIKR
jgi:hypothetical protein